MAKEEKDRRREAPVSKHNIVAVLVVVLICVYVIAECSSVLDVKYKTQTALPSVVYETIDTQALVVRDEQVIGSSGSAVTVPVVTDGEKIKLGGQIAMQFSNAELAQRYAKYLDLTKELEYYTALAGQQVGHVTDVESLDKAVLTDVNAYIRAVSGESSSAIEKLENSLNDKFTRRQMLIGEDIDFTAVISEINSQIDELNVESASPSGYITTDKSGVFSSYTDSLEEVLDYKNIEELDIDGFNSYVNAVQNATPSGSIGKIVKSFDWYLCAVVNTADLAGLKDGKSVDVALKASNNVLKCKIVKGADDILGKSQTLLILKCNELNSEIASLRLEDIQIRVNEYEGIKVPIQAVHINNGEKGVYALVSSVVEWRKADILYTGENFAVLTYNKDTEGGIKLYDQIITQGKELYDGKVYA